MASLAENIVAYYTFDNTLTNATGTASRDLSGSSFSYPTGKNNQGVELSASSGVLNVTTPFVLTSGIGWTISGWIYPVDTQSGWNAYGAFVAQSSSVGLFVRQTAPTTLVLEVWNGSAIMSTPLTNNTWQHFALAVTGSSAMAVLYINGVEVTRYTTGLTIQWTINRLMSFSPYAFRGVLDETVFHDRYLLLPEIQSLYNAGAGRFYPLPGEDISTITNIPLTFNSLLRADDYRLSLMGTVGGAPANTPPVVDNVTPTVGTTLGPTTPITLDVTDIEGFGRIRLSVKFANGDYDVVFDGTSFAPKYDQHSTVTPITDGYTFSVRPDAGWAAGSSPQLFVDVSDAGGLENA